MAPGDDGQGAVDLTDAAPVPAAPARHPRTRSAAALATGVVLAAGLVAHARAPSAASGAGDAAAPGAYQDAVDDALVAAAPAVSVQWEVGTVTASGTPDAPPVDVQRDAPVAGPLTAPVHGHVGYRVLDGLAPGAARRPCLVPTVHVEVWRHAQGGDQALACVPQPGGARGPVGRLEAVRQGVSAVPAEGGSSVAVREVVVVQGGRACAAAAWAVGRSPVPPLGLDALRQVARALAAVPGTAA